MLALPLTLLLALAATLALALAELLTLALSLTLALALLTLLSALALLALLSLLAAGAVGVIHQTLLLADQVAELIEHLHHLLAAAVLLLLLVAAGHAAGLQAVEHVAELGEHLLRHLAGALGGHLLELLEHLVEVLGPHELAGVRRHLLGRHALGLLLELLQELVEGLAELLHELLDFLVRGAAFESLGEFLLEFAQALFGGRQPAAVLDPQRKVPELVDGGGDRLALHAAAVEAVIDGAQAEVDGLVIDELVRRDGERVEGLEDQRAIARIEDEAAALLDQGAREGIEEKAFGEDDLLRLRHADVAGVVLGDQRHAHGETGPRVRADVVEGPGFGRFRAARRDAQRDLRRAGQRRARTLEDVGVLARPAGLGIAGVERHAFEAGLGGGDAVVVFHPVEQLHGAAARLLDFLGQRNRRGVVGDDVEAPGGHFALAGH